MKRGLGLLLLALLVLPGCNYLLPLANQPPKAYIDDISPSTAQEGDTVSFLGHGTDADGQVVAYRWRSTIDGELNSLASFDTNDLSEGEHTIYLQVQDNNGAWSTEVRASVSIQGAPMAPARINSFTVSAATIMAGEDTTLSWNVSNADHISLNQSIGNVQPVGSVSVSPSATTIYILTAQGGGSTATAQITVNVEQAELEIVFFRADPDDVESGEQVVLSWETRGASEVRIQPFIGPVALSGSISVYPTGDQTHTFELIVTDGNETVAGEVQVESHHGMPEAEVVILRPILSESGYVRSTGQVVDDYPYVGDDTSDASLQAFLSFDISDIPEDAVIESVVVDFSDHDSTYGDPFDDLGCLRAYAHQYGNLTGNDYYVGNPVGAISRWCNEDQLEDDGEDDDYVEALQDVLGQDRFQVRLQFNEEDTDNDGHNDLVRYTASHQPRLVVEYTA